MIVYNPEGVAEEKEPVDARECVERCGYTYEPPGSAVETETTEPKKTVKK